MGGTVNVALKSGTNELHGTLYHTHNNAHLQSMDLFKRQFLFNPATGPVTDEKRKQAYPYNLFNRYGGSLGGPWYIPKVYDGRNKTFWLFGYEGYRRNRNEPGSSSFTVPTMKQRGGDLSDLLALGSNYQVYDPATIAPAAGGRFSRQPIPGNIIPQDRLDQTALNILSYYPEPNTAGSDQGENNFFRPRQSQDKFGSYNGRVDHNFSQRYRIYGRYYKTSQVWSGGNNVFGNISTGQQLSRDSQGGGIDQVFTVNPAMLLNVRYSFARYINFNRPYSLGMDLAGLGLSQSLVSQIPAEAVMFPTVNVDKYQRLGNANNNISVTNYHVLAGDVSWMRGSHSMKFGADYRVFQENGFNYKGGTPTYTFGTNWTRGPLDTSPAAPIGQGLASMLLGLPTGGSIWILDSRAEQSTYTALFFQDDWKVTPKLTLNLGVRYEYDSPVTERFNRSVTAYDFVTPSPLEAAAKANYARSPIPEVPADQFRVIGGLPVDLDPSFLSVRTTCP